MITAFNTFFYEPLYNGLVFLISVIPGGDVGLAVIVLTIAVKFLLLPLSHKSVISQAKLRAIEPEAKTIKERHADNKQEQARQIMDLYRRHGINPFSGCLLIFIQLPIIFALYWVFFKGLPVLDPAPLYSFIPLPEHLNMKFLGIFDMAAKSFILALFAGLSQYYQMKLAMPPLPVSEQKKGAGGQPSFKEEFAKNMNVQMRYVLPGVVFFVAYTISSAVALYWLVSNVFSVIHELLVRRSARRIGVT